MMLLCGQSNRIWHYWAGRYPGSVGTLISPSYMRRVPIDPWMPFALDNGAFIAYQQKTEWDRELWLQMLSYVRMTKRTPLWAAVPDVVCDAKRTRLQWDSHVDAVINNGWETAFCVQDGMTPDDVPHCDVVFVGGSDRWKFPNLEMWTKNFPRVHCARVSSVKMLERCEELGCESVDSTAWFRAPDRADRVPALTRFIEGHRNPTPELELDKLNCV